MNAMAKENRMSRADAMKAFRDDVRDAVWENTAVGNAPPGEWVPEYFVPRGKENSIDEAMDVALVKLLHRMGGGV